MSAVCQKLPLIYSALRSFKWLVCSETCR